MKFNISSVLVIACLASASMANAKGVPKMVVYIECTKPGSPLSRGSGVLVSQDGHVLTAKHVVPDGYSCKGIPENATLPLRDMIKDPELVNVDATLLHFIPSKGEIFPSVKYCKLSDKFAGKTIYATGFPGGKSVGQPSIRQGVLSTTVRNDNGIVETDALTTRGMSGGPVILEDSSNLIGIVGGADFDPATGQPNHFGIVTVEQIANTFNLEASPNRCEKVSSPPMTQQRPVSRIEAYCAALGHKATNEEPDAWVGTRTVSCAPNTTMIACRYWKGAEANGINDLSSGPTPDGNGCRCDCQHAAKEGFMHSGKGHWCGCYPVAVCASDPNNLPVQLEKIVAATITSTCPQP